MIIMYTEKEKRSSHTTNTVITMMIKIILGKHQVHCNFVCTKKKNVYIYIYKLHGTEGMFQKQIIKKEKQRKIVHHRNTLHSVFSTNKYTLHSETL